MALPTTRAATPGDSEAIARIDNQGIEDRTATFETRPRAPSDLAGWFGTRFPVVVAEDPSGVIAWASASQFRARECYSGVAEISIYVDRERHGQGAGRLALGALVQSCAAAGFWKLLGGVIAENTPSLRLLSAAGFRTIGTYQRHAFHEGRWRDVVLLERLL